MSRFVASALLSLLMLTGPTGQACDDLLLLGSTDSFDSAADTVMSEANKIFEKEIDEYATFGIEPKAPSVGSGFALPHLIAYEVLKTFLKLKKSEDPISAEVLSRAYANPLSFTRPTVELAALEVFASLMGYKSKDLKKVGMGSDRIDYFAAQIEKVRRLRDVRFPIETKKNVEGTKPFLFTTHISRPNEPTYAWLLKTNYPGTSQQLESLQRFAIFQKQPNTAETLRELLIEAGYECESPKQLPLDMAFPAGVAVILVN